ncbi:phenylalanine--tRNA ligase subunit alpha [Candidatus Similichlamydia laticola]|uniref:Phenylalanine--tRNA ligase alpha subunit n=1 Tax=Candidatus Similichlamydia laticola TaxID=2170265 RepID=A0A369KKY7_9BACT|nr:phenylalanine--tRNA ligase subunit alpha [Candidatus Similichlamydia laticola]RDB31676.1 Phenylalanyl-tRNA synthetase alpha chain [Candidatus Similichlamydia laticola]
MEVPLSLDSFLEAVLKERSDFDSQFSHLEFSCTKEDREVLSGLRVRFLGRKGPLALLTRAIGQLEASARLTAGQAVNEQKAWIEEKITQAEIVLQEKEQKEKVLAERVDVTLPGRRKGGGTEHPLVASMMRALDILASMGFVIRFGEEIGTEEMMFDVLNFPKDHPARLEQDTYYLEGGALLRSQTSSAQVSLMRAHRPPLRFVVPGKCFRNEEISSRSLTVFHQIEGLYVDREVRLGDLLATLEFFFSSFVGRPTKLRFRSSYFPFVEPGLEVDLLCFLCGGHGCFTCKRSGWLEVAGAGMIHPNVLRQGQIDSEVYSGFAWGFGLERLVLLLHGIPDIRFFIENRPSFLKQFPWCG